MSTTVTPPSASPESAPSAAIVGSLFRMTTDQYERLVETGVLDRERIELINGLLVRKMGKRPPHVIACEAMRDELLPLIPQGWRLTIEAPVRIPDYDEPEPDLAIVRGTRDQYEDRHPSPADLGLLIEVADTTLDRDRGDKLSAYAPGGVPIYWIVNLVDRQLEVYSGPTPAGYTDRQIVPPGEQISLTVADKEAGRIAVSAILPRDRAARGSGPAKNT